MDNNIAANQVQSPYLNLNPAYLNPSDEYILPEDAAPVRSRAQLMFSTVGTVSVLGAGVGGLGSLRYGGLQWFSGKSKRMQLTSALIKNGGQMAQRFGAAGVLYYLCSIVCEKTRGVDDSLNTLVGGATAGGLFMIPGIMDKEKKPVEVKSKLNIIRRLPPAGKLMAGSLCGFTLAGIVCLSQNSGAHIVQDFTRR